MNIVCRRAAALLAAIVLSLGCGTAAADSLAVGAKAGTTGLGIEATWRLTDSVNLRGGYYAFDYGTDLEEAGVEYDGDLKLRNAAAWRRTWDLASATPCGVEGCRFPSTSA